MPKGMPGDYPPKVVIKDFSELADALSVKKEDQEETGGGSKSGIRKRGTGKGESKKSAATSVEEVEQEADPALDSLVEGVSSYMGEAASTAKSAADHAAKLDAAKSRLKQQRDVRKEARTAEIHTRLSELNKLASTKNVDAEAESLENELRSIEDSSSKREGVPVEASSEPSPAHSLAETYGERKEALRAVVTPLLEDHSGSEALRITDQRGEKAIRLSDENQASVIALHDQTNWDTSAHRDAVQTNEALYLTALKKFERKNTLWNKVTSGAALREEEQKLKALKNAYDESRVTYANALTTSADSRLKSKEYSPQKSAAVLERYNKIVRFNEVIKPAIEKKRQARVEALDARGKNTFEKGLGWIARQNQKLEKLPGGRATAIAIRSLAGAVGVSGFAAAAGGFGAAAVFGAGVFGAHKFARAFVGAYAGKLAADAAGEFYETRFGKVSQAQANEALRTEGRDTKNEVSLDDLRRVDTAREKLSHTADETRIQNKKALIKALAAFGVGAGTATLLTDVFAVQHAADTLASNSTPLPSSGLVPATDSAPILPVPDAPVPAPSIEAVAPEAPPSIEAAPQPLPVEAPTIHAEPVNQEVSSAPVNSPDSMETPLPPEPAPSDSVETEGTADMAIEDQSVETAELNREALEGHAMEPTSQEELSSSVPYETVQVDSEEYVPENPVTSEPEITSPESSPEIVAAEAPLASPDLELSQDNLSEADSPINHESPQGGTEPMANASPEASEIHASESSNAIEATEHSEAYTNNLGVLIDPNETHLYSLPDQGTPDGNQLVVFGGDNLPKDVFEAQIRELALMHPGREIMYQSPEPMLYEGNLVPWINTITAYADGSFRIPAAGFAVGEGFINKLINVDSLTNLIQ